MTTYQLILAEPAEAEIDAAYQWLYTRSTASADRFRDELAEAIRSLSQMPSRCAVAPENSIFEQEVRQLIFRHGRTAYRILFAIFEAEDDEPAKVRILRFRHGRQQRLNEETAE